MVEYTIMSLFRVGNWPYILEKEISLYYLIGIQKSLIVNKENEVWDGCQMHWQPEEGS